VTGGMDRYDKIEKFSKKKAAELNKEFDNGMDNEYFRYIYKANNNTHTHK
jgi:hypothetical protein